MISQRHCFGAFFVFCFLFFFLLPQPVAAHECNSAVVRSRLPALAQGACMVVLICSLLSGTERECASAVAVESVAPLSSWVRETLTDHAGGISFFAMSTTHASGFFARSVTHASSFFARSVTHASSFFARSVIHADRVLQGVSSTPVAFCKECHPRQ